jgi:hypothetical protein
VTDPNQNRPIQWPGVVAVLGFMALVFAFILLLIWTDQGVLPWQ